MKRKNLLHVLYLPLVLLTFMAMQAQLLAQQPEHIWFEPITQEIKPVWIGETFKFDGFKAKTDLNMTIRYQFFNDSSFDKEMPYPEGMTINEETGDIEWTPTQEGYYSVMVKAYLVEQPETETYNGIGIEVYDSSNYSPPCAYIKGTVKIKDGQPLNGVMLAVKPMDDSIHYNPYYDNFTMTDEQGNYSLNLPKGEYFLYAQLPNYSLIFYDNVYDYEKATTITLECDQTFNANFDIEYSDSLNYIFFNTYPEFNYYKPGDVFTYDADAVSYFGDVIKYELENPPQGMTVDENTGLVTFTIPDWGVYPVTLRASIATNAAQYTDQYFEIYAFDKSEFEPCAWINGTVKTVNNLFSGANVYAYSLDTTSYYYGRGGVYVGTSGDEGKYMINVPKGEYILYVEGWSIGSQYYDNTNDFTKATPVKVACDETKVIDFIVSQLVPPTYSKISGYVKSEDDGAPLHAIVEIIPEESPTPWLFDDSTGYYNGYPQMSAETDRSGYYEIEFQGNLKFKIIAFPMDAGYLPEYYDNTRDWTQATELELTGDLSNINFMLAWVHDYKNGIKGIVQDEDGKPVYAYVTAIGTLGYVDPYSTNINTAYPDSVNLGEFTLSNLVPDNYIIQVLPLNMDYVPGFYVVNDFATFDWDKATKIQIKENEIYPDKIIVKVAKSDGMYGLAKLEGSVVCIKNKPQETTPISGAMVSAVDKNGKVADYCYSDNSGHYKLNSVGVGDYKIVASKVGYENYERTLNFDMKENASVQSDIFLTPKNSPTDIDDNAVLKQDFKLYPNPASTNVSLQLTGKQGIAKIAITNMLGDEVYSRSINLSGNDKFALDVNALPQGIYIVRVTGQNIDLRNVLEVVR